MNIGYSKLSEKCNRNGFTIIELIIVITILIILSAISFISFQGYTRNARDTSRLSNLRVIETSLSIYHLNNNKYPNVDNGIEIKENSSTILGYQGYVGDNASRILKLDTPKDPLDHTMYVYSTNFARNKYQLMTFLEGENNMAFLGLGKTYADFSLRYPKTQGDNLGIILDLNNNPISKDVNLEVYDGPFNIVLNDNYKFEATESTLLSLKSSFGYGDVWNKLDKNCFVPDIVVGDQIWAGCNSTLGNGFDWDTGTCLNYQGTNITTNCSEAAYMSSDKKEKDWANTIGISGAVLNNTQDNIWGKFYLAEDGETACPSGRKVPSITDWITLFQNLGCTDSLSPTNLSWVCSGLGWSNNSSINENNNLIKKLKMPLSGNRSSTSFTFINRGNSNILWTSTPNSPNVKAIYIIQNEARIRQNNYSPLNSFNIRCIKE